MNQVVEFRGVDGLVYAEVLKDTTESLEHGEVKELSPMAEISKSVEQSSATKYYDNAPSITINATGPDTINIAVSVLSLKKVAEITGQQFDEESGALIEGERVTKYYAIGYRMKLTDGSYRNIWKLKGTFNIPEEASKTEDGGTDSQGQSVTYTAIYTTHRFQKTGKKAKAVVIDDNDAEIDTSTFFDVVTTPDNLIKREESLITRKKVEKSVK